MIINAFKETQIQANIPPKRAMEDCAGLITEWCYRECEEGHFYKGPESKIHKARSITSEEEYVCISFLGLH